MIHERSLDAITASAGLGMISGIVVLELATILGVVGTAGLVLVSLSVAVGVGIWLLPDVETMALLAEEREVLEDGDPS